MGSEPASPSFSLTTPQPSPELPIEAWGLEERKKKTQPPEVKESDLCLGEDVSSMSLGSWVPLTWVQAVPTVKGCSGFTDQRQAGHNQK